MRLKARLSFLILFMSLGIQWAMAQNCRYIKVSEEQQILDSLTLVPSTITFPNDTAVSYQFDLNTNSISFQGLKLDSIRICYRTLPFDLHTNKARRTLDIYDSTALFKDALRYQESLIIPKRQELFRTENIAKTGSISRGVSFGNRQDVFVNSTLNLQMEGELSDGVNLRAVITDQNVPFQPEGNTQQLQDFDNVFIELFSDKWRVKAGDVVLRKTDSNFLRYYKNVQGGQFSANYEMKNGFKAQTSVAGSVAKGRFASVSVDPLEGVQGPYRVRGPNNERFIIILAGSEKVFIDGKQLVRGYDNDYTIDYNLAEITFTNRVVITQFTRIRVDYEFSDQNYSRFIVQAGHQQSNDKINFGLHFYNEKDNRNQPLAFDLSQEEKQILADAGDDLNSAVTRKVDSVAFNPNLIQYRKIIEPDVNGMPTEVFQYSTNPDSAFFLVEFSEVGQGNGNYTLSDATSNGRIYEWAPPVNGQLQGNFEPVSRLFAPNQKRMFTANAGVKLTSYDEIQAELALSRNDLNLFSDLDNEDNDGTAYKVIYNTRDRPVNGLPSYKFNAGASYEFNSESFSFIDRVRYIEFDRDWSYDPSQFTENYTENIFNANASLRSDQLNGIDVRWVGRKRGEAVDGNQLYFDVDKDIGPFRLKFDAFYMNNDQLITNSEWARYSVDASFNSKWLIPGYRYRVDRNEVRNNADNAVISTAMNFAEHSFYLKNADSLKTQYGVEVQLREDRLPMNGELVNNNQSETYNFFFNTIFNPTNRLSVLLTYRDLQTVGKEKSDETIMGRVDWNATFFDRIIQSDFSYNLSNSRELRREFIFIPVPTGEGTHTWRDDNGDGVQDLNEFYIAINPDEKNYAKIFVPTDTFVDAFNTIISYRLNVNFPRDWRKSSGFKKFIQHFSNISAWSLNSKITDDDLGSRLWPTNVAEEDILASKEILRSTLFYNRTNSKFGADIGFSRSENKQLLFNGFEKRLNRSVKAHVRWNLNPRLNFDFNYINGSRSSLSDVLIARNYLVVYDTYQPSLAWQPTSRLRLTTTVSWKEKFNDFDADSFEKASLRQIGVDAKLSKAATTTIGANVKFVDIAYNGVENSPVGYEMLEALRPGQNMTWNLSWQQRIGSGLQLVLRYDGRKSGENQAVHLGRVQISALF